MPAQLLTRERQPLAEDLFKEVIIWRLPAPLPGSTHPFKYRLALVHAGQCVLRYDNERGKGDHKHVDGAETPVTFVDLATLFAQFHDDIETWRYAHGNTDDPR
jgi:hypothetical protein